MVWRILFIGVMLYSLIDGFISNMLFIIPVALLYKDILLIITVILFAMTEDLRSVISGLGKYLGGFVFFFGLAFIFTTIAQIFNPYSPGLVIGLLGFKLYFLYWFAVPLAYVYVDSVNRALTLLKIIVFASIFVNIFGLYQFIAGPRWIIEHFGPGFIGAFREAALDEATGPSVKSFVRVIASFASTGQYSNFLQCNIMLCFPLIFSAETLNKKIFWTIPQVLNFVCLLAAGSRGSIMFSIGEVGLFFLFARSRRPFTGMLVITVVSLCIGLLAMGKGVRARFSTISSAGMVQERTVGSTSKIFMVHLDKYPLGRGIGFASTAARHLGKSILQTKKETWVENYPTKLEVEVGLPGVIIFFVFLGSFLKRWCFDWLPRLGPETWNIGLPLTAYGVGYLSLMSLFGILETTPGALFVCVVIGIILRLLDLSENPAETEQVAHDS